LQEQKKAKWLDWFRTRRELMDNVYHQYKKVKVRVESAVYVFEDEHNPGLDPKFDYTNDTTIRAAILNSSPYWDIHQVSWWLTQARIDLEHGCKRLASQVDNIRDRYEKSVRERDNLRVTIERNRMEGEDDERILRQELEQLERLSDCVSTTFSRYKSDYS
jgi:hypothetical protein